MEQSSAASFIAKISKPSNYWYFSLTKLPSLLFWGIRIKSFTEKSCVIRTKYNYRNTNPFKSMYFSALCGSGELSTGLLVMAHSTSSGKWSMLVTSFQSNFYKKAVGQIEFTCDQGDVLVGKMEEIRNSEHKTGTIILSSVAKNEAGEIVAEFHVTWSLKAK